MSNDFEKFVLAEAQKQIAELVADAQMILKKNVELYVYDSYSLTEYELTYSLENSITCDFDTTSGKIYFEDNSLSHYSAVTGESTKDVPYYTDMGHHDSTGKVGMYHNYNARDYIQKTIDELELKYGKDCVQRLDD